MTTADPRIAREKLGDPDPAIRVQAIETLRALDDVASIDALARLLSDDAVAVAMAARTAFDALQASATRSGRCAVHVFVSTGRFGSFDELRAYVDATYNPTATAFPPRS